MDKLTKFFSITAAFILSVILILILKDIFINSIGEINFSYLYELPRSAGRRGGIFPIIISTLLILTVCLAVVVPIGLATSLFLTEYRSTLPFVTSIIRKSIQTLAGVPSIVFGLFGNALFSVYLGLGFSILSGGLTLALMSLPLFISSVEHGIRQVPTSYKDVATSLGLSKTTTIITIILPYSLPSIGVGIVLSIGRSLAETAALIFTSGYVDRVPESLFDSGRSLSIHIYDLAMNVPGGDTNAYKSSLVLILLIISTNGLFNIILKSWYKKRIAL